MLLASAHELDRDGLGVLQGLPGAHELVGTFDRESVDAAECWVLGSVTGSETRRAWIDVDTGALRKAEHFHVIDPHAVAQDAKRRIADLPPEEQAKLKDLGVLEHLDQTGEPTRWESTTVWRPQFDEDIPTPAFAFDPASLT